MESPIDKDKITEIPGLLPYAHHVGSGLIRPEDIGKIKGRAMSAMVEQTNMQLKQIYEQMKLLSEQARSIRKRFEISKEIYQAAIHFEPVIGQIYYLYERQDGSKVLSLIGPNQWGRKMPFCRYVASVKLLADHTWEVIEE